MQGQASGCRVSAPGFWHWGLRCRVEGSGGRSCGLGSQVHCFVEALSYRL